jgi:hypothetical protein
MQGQGPLPFSASFDSSGNIVSGDTGGKSGDLLFKTLDGAQSTGSADGGSAGNIFLNPGSGGIKGSSGTNDGIDGVVSITGDFQVTGSSELAMVIFPFGDAGASGTTRYLETINGVATSAGPTGYRMMRNGWITGISAQYLSNGIGGTGPIFSARQYNTNGALVSNLSTAEGTITEVASMLHHGIFKSQKPRITPVDFSQVITMHVEMGGSGNSISLVTGFVEVVFETGQLNQTNFGPVVS